MVDLSETYSNNYSIISEYVKCYRPTPVKTPVDPNVTDLSYDPNSTVKSIKQQQKHLSEAETQTIVDKYKAGASTYELAQEFGCHRYTISNALKRSGIVVDKHVEGRKYKAEEVIRLYVEEKKSVAELAKKFGICDATIYKCLKRNGVYTKRTRWDYE
ncbi:MAG: helix-turn-helix domain-containing protein [Oscillospiraceae bacterium]|nr:helix-turn-helix domain-containing protein [Oscillospiraceae bacterium]